MSERHKFIPHSMSSLLSQVMAAEYWKNICFFNTGRLFPQLAVLIAMVWV